MNRIVRLKNAIKYVLSYLQLLKFSPLLKSFESSHTNVFGYGMSRVSTNVSFARFLKHQCATMVQPTPQCKRGFLGQGLRVIEQRKGHALEFIKFVVSFIVL